MTKIRLQPLAVSYYCQVSFIALCAGIHVQSDKSIKITSLLPSVASLLHTQNTCHIKYLYSRQNLTYLKQKFL